MLFTCKCLNLTVKVAREHVEHLKTQDLCNFLSEQNVGNTNTDVAAFFKQIIGPIAEVNNIIKLHDSLVATINVTDWMLNRCLNCRVTVFATANNNTTIYLNPECLKTSDQVEKIQSDPAVFSPTFGIAMMMTTFGDDDSNHHETTTTTIINKMDGARVKALEWHMQQKIMTETEAVEERIRVFSEKQWNQMKIYKLRAEQEFNMLCNMMNVPETTTEQQHQAASKTLMETPPATPDNTPMSLGNSPPLDAANAGFFNKNQQKIPNKVKNIAFTTGNKNSFKHSSGSHVEGSLDSDGIFDLDGMMEDSRHPHKAYDSNPDLDESDEEDERKPTMKIDVGVPPIPSIQIPRQSTRNSSIAKSLPISMPVSMQPYRPTTDEDFDELPEDNNVDIAASIKALARSVHGDAIFGDLPEPRRPKFAEFNI